MEALNRVSSDRIPLDAVQIKKVDGTFLGTPAVRTSLSEKFLSQIKDAEEEYNPLRGGIHEFPRPEGGRDAPRLLSERSHQLAVERYQR